MLQQRSTRAIGANPYPYLVAQFFDVRFRKLLALAELFDPYIDFVFHVYCGLSRDLNG